MNYMVTISFVFIYFYSVPNPSIYILVFGVFDAFIQSDLDGIQGTHLPFCSNFFLWASNL